MARYTWRARDIAGRPQSGTAESASEAALLDDLRSRGLLPVEVRAAGGGGGTGGGGTDLDASWRDRLFSPRSVDVEVALHQLALMLRGGMPLLASLRMCAGNTPRRSLRVVWGRVAERIQEGWSLSESLAEHRCFPPLTVAMARVGEQTGSLDAALQRAAGGMERRRLVVSQVRTALAYPTIVFVMAVGAVVFMLVTLIPKIRGFLVQFGRKLPPMTQALVDVSDSVETHLWHGVILAVLVCAAWIVVRRWPPGRLATDRGLLRVPIVGGTIRLAATASFARSLSTLLASGVRLTEALRASSEMQPNRWVRTRIDAARDRVLAGGDLAPPLAEGRVFLPLLSGMVAAGESSGALDEVLAETAGFHESRLEARIRRLASLLEPALIVAVGGTVGFVYVSCFMAIYSIAGRT